MRNSSLALVILVALVFSGCLNEEKKKPAASMMQMPPPTVQTLNVTPKEIEIDYIYPSRISTVHDVSIVSKVSGTLEKKHFKQGERVKQGDLLYEIEDAKYRANYSQALANEFVAQTSLKNVTRTWERVKSLYESDAVSKQEYDDALGAYESAKANLIFAKAALEVAKVDLDYTKIYSPIDGVAGETKIEEGNYISAVNTPLVTITKLNPIFAEFSLPDRDFQVLKSSLNQAKIVLESSHGELSSGEISFQDSIMDAKTSTVKLKGEFVNDENSLLPGMFSRIHVKGIILKDVMTIPQKALLQDPSGTYLFVVKDGVAMKTPVRIGRAIDGEFIIEEGLNEGDELILDNLTKLRQGMPVNVAKG